MILTKSRKKTLAWSLLIILSLIWGTSFILIKKSLVAFDSSEVGALRMLTAGFVLIPFIFSNCKEITLKKWITLFIVGFLGSFIPAFLFSKAEERLDSSLAGVLNALTPLFVLIIGSLVYNQRFSKFQIIGIIISFFGTFFLMFAGAENIKNINFYGFFIVLATICYGINANIIKFNLKGLTALTITSMSLVLVFPISITYILFFTDVTTQIIYEPEARLSFLYISILGILSTAIAMLLFNKLIQITSPLFTTSVTYLIPIIAVIWGLLDGEILLIGHYFGMLAILVGVYIANYKK